MKSTLFFFILLSIFHTSLFSQDWTEVSSPPQFLTHHSFGFSIDGLGYLVTGASGGSQTATDEFFEYDPVSDSWTQLDDFPSIRSFAIGDVHDGKAYFGFGQDGISYKNDFWVFDPNEGIWQELASCPCSARIHPALVAIEGKVYMGLGGAGGDEGNLGDWWEYDMATNSWEEKASFPGANRHHPYQFNIGEDIYVGLGHGNDIYNDLYKYDIDSDTWEEMTSLPGEARVAGTQFSYEGKGYVLSGEGDDHGPMETGEFWSYDPVTDSWDALTAHPGSSRWAPASFVINDEVYLINGMVRDFFTFNFEYQDVTYKFSLDNSASIQGIDASEFKLYPNPTQDQVNILSLADRDVEIRLMNALGQSVLEISHLQKDAEKIRLDLSQLDSGVYYLKIGEVTKKIQKI